MESKSDVIGRAMQAAWTRVKKAQTRIWSEWRIIGDGLLEGRRVAMQRAGTNRPEGKGYATAYAEWLNHYKVADIHKTVRGHLLCIMEELAAIEEMRATWTLDQRRDINHPTTVWRKFQALTRAKPKPKPSAAEHGRAQRVIEEQQAYISELEASRRDDGLSSPEREFIEAMRQARKGSEDNFRVEVAFTDGAWEVKLSEGNKFGRGVGATFSDAWDNLAPSWA